MKREKNLKFIPVYFFGGTPAQTCPQPTISQDSEAHRPPSMSQTAPSPTQPAATPTAVRETLP